jgi:hypothetical protein
VIIKRSAEELQRLREEFKPFEPCRSCPNTYPNCGSYFIPLINRDCAYKGK